MPPGVTYGTESRRVMTIPQTSADVPPGITCGTESRRVMNIPQTSADPAIFKKVQQRTDMSEC